MKLHNQSICFVIDSDSFKNHHINYIRTNVNLFNKSGDAEDKINFFKETNFRTLVFSQKSHDNLLKNYIPPKKVDFKMLESLPNRKDIILFNETTCVKYVKTETTLTVTMNKLSGRTDIEDVITLFYFRYNFVDERLLYDKFSYDKTVDLNWTYQQFLLIVTYLELTKVTLTVVETKSKNGDIFRGNFIKNESLKKVIQVNTNWNTHVINVGGFSVRGHKRLQLCGRGSNKKLDWVDVRPYEKGLLRRLPQKELV